MRRGRAWSCGSRRSRRPSSRWTWWPVAETRVVRSIEWYMVPGAPEQPQCARCGSSVEWLDCSECAGEGHHGSAGWDDLCHGNEECIYGDEDTIPCDFCGREGGSLHCGSGPGWCIDHSLPLRESIESTAIADT